MGLNWIPEVFPTATDVVVGAGSRAMEIPGADWLDLLLLLHAARKQIATGKRNAEIRRLATTASLHRKNVSVITLIA
jgi:hypothetical protein